MSLRVSLGVSPGTLSGTLSGTLVNVPPELVRGGPDPAGAAVVEGEGHPGGGSSGPRPKEKHLVMVRAAITERVDLEVVGSS